MILWWPTEKKHDGSAVPAPPRDWPKIAIKEKSSPDLISKKSWVALAGKLNCKGLNIKWRQAKQTPSSKTRMQLPLGSLFLLEAMSIPSSPHRRHKRNLTATSFYFYNTDCLTNPHVILDRGHVNLPCIQFLGICQSEKWPLILMLNLKWSS